MYRKNPAWAALYASVSIPFLLLVSGQLQAREGLRVPENPAHAWSSPLATQSLLIAVEKFHLYPAHSHPSHERLIAVGERGHILTYEPHAKVGSCFITRRKRAKKRSLQGVNEHFERPVCSQIPNAVRECEGTFAYSSYEKKIDPDEPARVPGALPLPDRKGGADLSRQGDGLWRQATRVPTRVLLTGVSFPDARHGWAVGHDAVILATVDGGKTWRKVHEAIDEERPLLDVHFQDEKTGIAVGAYGYLLRTGDGGASWQSGTVNPEHDFHLNAIAVAPAVFIEETTPIAVRSTYVAAESGYVYRSDDGGKNWRTLKPPYDGSLFGVYPMTGGRVMAFGLRGHLFLSEDRGEHWRAVETGTRATLTSATGLGDGRILLTGHGGVLLLADADLERIRRARLPERKALSDAVEIGPGRVVLVGEAGLRTVVLCGIFPEDTAGSYGKKLPTTR